MAVTFFADDQKSASENVEENNTYLESKQTHDRCPDVLSLFLFQTETHDQQKYS